VPKLLTEFLDLQPGGSALAPLAAAAADHDIGLERRIGQVAHWLTSGEPPASYVRAAENRAVTLMEAVTSGAAQVDTIADRRIAVVRGDADGLLRLGYCLAPVVVALNRAFQFRGGEPHAKFTVAQYRQGYVDLTAAVADLAALEPGWGGSATIIGSPQGEASRLTIDTVAAIVEKRLLR
jgi:hypothetical protein